MSTFDYLSYYGEEDVSSGVYGRPYPDPTETFRASDNPIDPQILPHTSNNTTSNDSDSRISGTHPPEGLSAAGTSVGETRSAQLGLPSLHGDSTQIQEIPFGIMVNQMIDRLGLAEERADQLRADALESRGAWLDPWNP
jgi:hypothetical protein